MTDVDTSTDVQTPAEDTPDPGKDARRLLWIRILARFEFGATAVGALTIVVTRLVAGPESEEVLFQVLRLLLVPAFIVGTSVTAFHAKMSGRDLSSTLGEIAFWLVWVVFAGVTLWLI